MTDDNSIVVHSVSKTYPNFGTKKLPLREDREKYNSLNKSNALSH